jgi:hypothetical protein
VDKAKAVKAKARQKLVVYKIGNLFAKRILFFIVAVDGQNLSRSLVNGNDVGQLDSRWLVLQRVLKPDNVQVAVEFQSNNFFRIDCFLRAFQLVICFLCVIGIRFLHRNVNVPVHAAHLFLSKLIAHHFDNVGYALA